MMLVMMASRFRDRASQPFHGPLRAAMPRRLSVAHIILLGASACLNGTELVSPPYQPPSPITIVFHPDSADAATASALGWSAGIPGIEITLTADSTNSVPQTFQGSDSGTLVLDQLAAGRYSVSAIRWLADSERAKLPPGDDAVGFMTRFGLTAPVAAARLSLAMVADRRRGIVISEWKGDAIQAPGQSEAYYYSGYVRLYNNSDSTIYLDGMIIGEGFAWQFDYPNFPCSLYQPYALDSLGFWARVFHQLPGSGQDYPLGPGETAVLATDAIDHRPLYPIGLDLRQANFEFYAGQSDVDNPNVPNAVSVGTESEFGGHGLYWGVLGTIVWVARPFDLSTMHTEVIPSGGIWARIPASALVDVVAVKTTYQGGYPECPSLVNSIFDREAVQLLGAPPEDQLLAYRRRQLPFTIAGPSVLPHSPTAAWDFVTAPRNPWTIP